MERAWVSSPSYEAAMSVITQARKAAGLSQRDLAARLRKPRSYISKIELRERRLDIVEFVELSLALDVSPQVLLAHLTAVLPSKPPF